MTWKWLRTWTRRVRRHVHPQVLWQRVNIRLVWRRYNKRLHVLLWFLALVIGPFGFNPEACNPGVPCEPRGILDRIYLTLQLFTLESGMADGSDINVSLQLARFFAAIAAAWTLLRTIGSDFIDLAKLQWAGLVGGHIVVCGLGQTGSLLVETLTRRGVQVVAIEKDPNGPYIAQAREQGATVLIGDATQTAVLRLARVGKAARIIAVTTPDSANVEIAFQARSVKQDEVDAESQSWSIMRPLSWAMRALSSAVRGFLKRRGRPLVCIVHLAEPRLWAWFQWWRAGQHEREHFQFEPVNAYDASARVCFEEYEPVLYPRFYSADVKEPPCVLIVGLGQFGTRLLIQTAKLWRDRPTEDGSTEPLRVTVVDRRPEDAWSVVVSRNPELAETCRVSWVSGDVTSLDFRSGTLLGSAATQRHFELAYVCLGDEVLALEASLALLRATAPDTFPIVVRLREQGGLGHMLREGNVDGLERTRARPFPTIDDNVAQMLIEGTNEYLARMLHGAYLRYQVAEGVAMGSNLSMVAWRDLNEELRVSNRHQAEHIEVKLRAIHCRFLRTDGRIHPFAFTEAEVEILARMEHERWCDERREAGWTYGEQRNNDEKTHPLLVSWDTLEEVQEEPGRPHPQKLNREAINALPTILARAGFRIERVPSWRPGGIWAAGD